MQLLSDAFRCLIRHDWPEDTRQWFSVPLGYDTAEQFNYHLEALIQRGELSFGLLRHLWSGLGLTEGQFTAMYYALQQTGMAFPMPERSSDEDLPTLFVTPLAGLDRVKEQVTCEPDR